MARRARGRADVVRRGVASLRSPRARRPRAGGAGTVGARGASGAGCMERRGWAPPAARPPPRRGGPLRALARRSAESTRNPEAAARSGWRLPVKRAPGRRSRSHAGTRSPFLMTVAIVLIVAVAAFYARRAWSGRSRGHRPNVLLITIDTLRWDHVGCYGAAQAATPVLDALAARGVRFETAIAHAPLTAPSH